MLAIAPDIAEDEFSSDSSDSTDKTVQRTDKRVDSIDLTLVLRSEQVDRYAAAAARGSTQSCFQPGDTGETQTSNMVDGTGGPCPCACTGSVEPADSQTRATTTCLSNEQLQKFAELKEKRIQASKEKVAEGYRRCRRRKRKNDDPICTESPQHLGGHKEKTPEDLLSKLPADLSPGSTSEVMGGEKSTGSVDERWDMLKEYLDVNSHMSQGVDHGQYAPKSGLEKRLDEAVAEGDFERAEELSEELSARDFACRVAKAANARDYMNWKMEREEEKSAKKRKKKKRLAWGFEVKNRWEMKANM